MIVLKRIGVVVVFVSAVLACCAASALATSPWWRVSMRVAPSVLPVHGEGSLVVSAINMGDAQAASTVESPLTLTARVPAGMKVVEEEVAPGVLRPKLELSIGPAQYFCSLASGTVTCILPEGYVLLPYESVQLTIAVKAGEASEESRVEASGGGASPVATARTVRVGATPPAFGVERFEQYAEEEGGNVDVQAGSHPYAFTTALQFNENRDPLRPPAMPRSLRFDLPPGMVGNATFVPQCTELKFHDIINFQNTCPSNTAIGAAVITFDEPKQGFKTWTLPVFNLAPARGEPARFGFTVVQTPVVIDTSVRTGGDYGVVASVNNIAQSVNFIGETVSFWGVPGSPVHNESRGWCIGGGIFNLIDTCPAAGQGGSTPFLTLPTSCQAPWLASVEGESWPLRSSPDGEPVSLPLPKENTHYSLTDGYGRTVGLTGCNQLSFSPLIEAAPDVQSASSASGLTVHVRVPQEVSENAEGLASSSVRGITVALPPGMQVNPSDGNGLEACGEHQVGYLGLQEYETLPKTLLPSFTPGLPEPLSPGLNLAALGFCPDAAKVASVKVKSPLIDNPLEGSVYLATQNDNPFGSLVAMYLVAEDPVSGTIVKLPGEVRLCEAPGEVLAGMTCQAPGQLISAFDDQPQLPFEDAELHFFGGERAPLATPARCGEYTTLASVEPWSGNAPISSSSTFRIASGPDGGPCPGQSLPFDPSLTGGTTSNNAGNLSPLSTTIARGDGEQNMQSVKLHMPSGLSGLLSSVKLCGETQANEGTCGPESLIGETTVSAGIGSQPVFVKGGRVYITEKYGDAPFGLSIVNPVKTGPFDLERDTGKPATNMPPCDCVVVRAKIEVDPITSDLTVTTDPSGPHAIPHLIDGIPVQIQKVNVLVNRPGFTFNPTDCGKLEMTGTIASDEGASAPVAVPFQATNCAVLGFKPSLSATVSSKVSRADGTQVTFKISYPKDAIGKQAWLSKVKFDLPKQIPARLTTLQQACVAATFNRNPASCPLPSKIGTVVVHTPLLSVPLEGPVIFVSNGGSKFPEAVLVLQGEGVTVDVHAETYIDEKTGVTSAIARTVPGVPFENVAITLPAGPFSEFSANGSLCQDRRSVLVKKRVKVHFKGRTRTVARTVRRTASALALHAAFDAQNGMEVHTDTPMQVTGCSAVKAMKAKTNGRRRKGR